MARIATYTSNTRTGRYLQLTIDETVNTAANTSTLAWTFSAIGGDATSYSVAETTIAINGTQVYHKDQTIYDAHVFPTIRGSVSGTIDVTHDTNGTKTIAVVFSTSVYYLTATNYGGQVTLTALDRAAPSILSLKQTSKSHKTTVWSITTDCQCNQIFLRAQYNPYFHGGSRDVSPFTSTTFTMDAVGYDYDVVVFVKVRKVSNGLYSNETSVHVNVDPATKLNSVPTITADNGTVTISLSANVYDNTLNHDLEIKNGSTSMVKLVDFKLTGGTEQSNSNYTITLPNDKRTELLTAMASVKMFQAGIVLSTSYYQGTSSGISKKTSTVSNVLVQTTSANSAPIFPGFSYLDSNPSTVAITGNNQILIESTSLLRVLAQAATARNGATLSSYSVSFGNLSKTSTSTTIDVGVVGVNGTVPLNVTAIDSRGWTTLLTVNVEVISAMTISMTNCSVRRVNEVETYCEVSISGELMMFSVDGINRNPFKSLEYRAYKTSDIPPEYTEITGVTFDNDSFSFESNNWLNLDPDYSYYIDIRASDQMSSDSERITISQSTALMSFRRKKVGINNRNPQKALDVIGDIGLSGRLIVDGALVNLSTEVQTIGGWSYVVCMDGLCICWKTYSGNSGNISTAWGNLYYTTESSGSIPAQPYPVTFAEVPNVFVTPEYVNNWFYFLCPASAGTVTETSSYLCVRPVTGSNFDIKVNILVIGRIAAS